MKNTPQLSYTVHLLAIVSFLIIFPNTISYGQSELFEAPETFTRADTLRGTLSPIRTWFDVTYYDLVVSVEPEQKTIEGTNRIYFKVVQEKQPLMQIDLFENLAIDQILFGDKALNFTREFNAVFIEIPQQLQLGSIYFIEVHYSGTPQVAENPPWDGGFVWSKDKNQQHWISVPSQGIGASIWYPNKDHQSDEPDSMKIACIVPDSLKCVCNGKEAGVTKGPTKTQYDWKISYPINNYCVALNIGDYVRFSDTYESEDKDTLALDYYVLSYNEGKAKQHFEQVKPMMACFEYYLGKYPFWDDGFALIETPYFGMEHQSGIAYGNNFLPGYNGFDYSRIGMQFDYIIIHEAGHEWWGNSLTTADIADMWIHEGFCTYSEALYVECLYGYDKALEYVNARKVNVNNDRPVIGAYGVNHEGSGDMYDKGMLILNTLRHIIDDDPLWQDILLGLTQDYEHQIVTHELVESYIEEKTGKDFTLFFDQYLRYKTLPELNYKVKQKGKNLVLYQKWKADVPNFSMPMRYKDAAGDWQETVVTDKWQKVKIKELRADQLVFGTDFYYFTRKQIAK